MRRTRLGLPLVAIILLAALSIVRGAAFPTGYQYDGHAAAWELLRSVMTFAFYFLGFWMVRGARDRRRMSWAIVIGLLAEAAVTIAFGRNGRGGRAIGSFGQPNELGAFLAMFTAFAAAQLPAARRSRAAPWWRWRRRCSSSRCAARAFSPWSCSWWP